MITVYLRKIFQGGDGMQKLALVLAIIGALNWGLVGLFSFDLVAWIFGGTLAAGSRIVYTLVALGGIWSIGALFSSKPA